MWVWDSHCEGRNVPSGWGSSGGGGVGVGRTDGLTGPGASSSTSTMLRSWSSLLASKLAVQGLDFVHIDNAFLHSSHQFFFSSRLVDTITMTPDHWGSSEHFQERRLMETPSDVNSSRHIFELLLIGSNNLNRSARLLPPARPDQRRGRLWSALVLNGTHFPSTCPALSSFSHHLVPLSPSLFNLPPSLFKLSPSLFNLPYSLFNLHPFLIQTYSFLVQATALSSCLYSYSGLPLFSPFVPFDDRLSRLWKFRVWTFRLEVAICVVALQKCFNCPLPFFLNWCDHRTRKFCMQPTLLPFMPEYLHGAQLRNRIR